MIVKQLSENVLAILSTAEIDGLTVRLTCGRLDCKLYVEVNDALEALGGKWNRKTRGHDFKCDPSEKIENAILTGEVIPPSRNGYFPTPKAVVQQLIELADLKDEMSVLEPSAGQGAIVDELRSIGFEPTVCEILPENARILMAKNYYLACSDFFELKEKRFDRVIMNPPFEFQADIDHVLHAHSLLRSKGLLVSVMSAGISFRQDKKAVAFRKFIEENNGEIIRLPIGSFKESGTGVNAVIVTVCNMSGEKK